MRVWRVGRRSDSHYLLILRDDWGTPLVMAIGPCEALAIWAGMQAGGVGPGARERRPRVPATHDLIGAMISRLGGRLEKVVVDDLWNGTYYAKLHLTANGQRITVDARPSDSIALALRANAPLYVTEEVLTASREPEDSPESEADGSDPLAGLEEL